ncbi:ATP-dependent DNA helicase PcrA [gut metagenome]|uniref:ATP-dependent DNA helicase PcrA n=1 Tax=gut metagenome TaxID=749906 RepID=J9GRH1_9ZZZZ
MLEAQGDEGAARLENLGQLVSSVKNYEDQKAQSGEEASLAEFLEEVALISDIDSYNEDSDVVILMTMHSAKGLEFDHVFIVGMEEGIFPSEMCRFSQDELEEERRLCYVGITRARKELYLSSSQTRMIFGQTRRNPPSRFLEEIDPGYLVEEESPAIARHNVGGIGGSSFDRGSGFGACTAISSGNRQWGSFGAGAANARYRPAADRATTPFGKPTVGFAQKQVAYAKAGVKPSYAVGDMVEHKVFGRGVVLKATPAAGDMIVEIRFDTAGVKKTMANYAPMHKIEK